MFGLSYMFDIKETRIYHKSELKTFNENNLTKKRENIMPRNPYVNMLHKMRILDFINPRLILDDNKTILNKDNSLTRVIKITGRNFTGLTKEDAKDLFMARVNAFKEPSEDISLQIFIDREKEEVVASEKKFLSKHLRELHELQQTKNEDDYITEIHIVFTLNRHIKDRDENYLVASIRKNLGDLDSQILKFIQILEPYRPRVLTTNSSQAFNLLSFLSKRLNFTKKLAVPKSRKDIHLALALTSLELDEVTGLITFKFDGKKEYGYLCRLNSFPDETYQEMLDLVSSIRKRFTIIQNVAYHNNDKIRNKIIKESNSKISTVTTGLLAPFKLLSAFSEIFSQYDEIIKYLAEGKTRVVDYSFQILIYGDSVEEIEETLSAIKLSLKISGIEIVRETENLENAFFSQMTGYEKLNKFREIPICTHSLASFSSLSSVSEGLKSCTWGNEPVCQLQTTSNTKFNFTFHESEESMAAGSTAIIGKSGSGKTTFAAKLIADCLSYGGNKAFGGKFKALIFDANRGLHPQVKALGGEYIQLGDPKNLPMNPFLLPEDSNDSENVKFLNEWVCALVGGKESLKETEVSAIEKGIHKVLELRKEHRKLGAMIPILKSNIEYKEGEVSLVDKLDKWIYKPDEHNNICSHYFNADKEALNFDKQIIAFDMDALLKGNEELLVPLLMYITHSYNIHISRNPSPNMILIDEAHTYLKNAVGANYVDDMVLKIRKSNGVVVFLTQTAGHILNSHNGKSINQNLVTKMVFPNSEANKDELLEFGLNESDIAWVTKAGVSRQLLIKKNGMQSVFVNIDFSNYGKYLHLFTGALIDIPLIDSFLEKHEQDEAIDLYLQAKESREQARKEDFA